ncbi:hypothetical protein GYMLUDRAFT_62180 [Collybiopsis luxurians FD-317 M1]|uniref:Uncharacterized protein n=1 Tax=Collybiopsis luxurians FD-317 M1 TaxID=944289 RepID=A0A0D0CDI4_9AGAR|nr:hypothetical protein GYMLUDRAFT_62180 [Collybiopsis luxurians FD-317 M1]
MAGPCRIWRYVLFAPSIGADVTAYQYTESFPSPHLSPPRSMRKLQRKCHRLLHLDHACGFQHHDASPSYEPQGLLVSTRLLLDPIEIHRPAVFDQNRQPGPMVLKRENATGLCIGRSPAYTTSKTQNAGLPGPREWILLPRAIKSFPFSTLGPSGAVVVNGHGQKGGNHRRCWRYPFLDIEFLMKRVAEKIPQLPPQLHHLDSATR